MDGEQVERNDQSDRNFTDPFRLGPKESENSGTVQLHAHSPSCSSTSQPSEEVYFIAHMYANAVFMDIQSSVYATV